MNAGGVWGTRRIPLTIFGFPLKTARCGYVNRHVIRERSGALSRIFRLWRY